MSGNERRDRILRILTESKEAISGNALAKRFSVSRQVIVTDIALLRANGAEILSTNLGYICEEKQQFSRVFKVHHKDEETASEMELIVDYGGMIEDVFVYHKAYGILRADLNIRTRRNITDYMHKIESGHSGFLKKITSDYHYHTVIAEDEYGLDLIQEKLKEAGFLASLQDYEPINFWSENSDSE